MGRALDTYAFLHITPAELPGGRVMLVCDREPQQGCSHRCCGHSGAFMSRAPWNCWASAVTSISSSDHPCLYMTCLYEGLTGVGCARCEDHGSLLASPTCPLWDLGSCALHAVIKLESLWVPGVSDSKVFPALMCL